MAQADDLPLVMCCLLHTLGCEDCWPPACRTNQWTQEFADGVKFTKDPVVCTPDVTEIELKEDDEFVIIASDGLW